MLEREVRDSQLASNETPLEGRCVCSARTALRPMGVTGLRGPDAAAADRHCRPELGGCAGVLAIHPAVRRLSRRDRARRIEPPSGRVGKQYEALPGNALVVEWKLTGGRREPSSLQVLLCGKEHATNDAGDSTSTHTKTFFERTLLTTDFAIRGESGRLSTMIPLDAMHSMRLPNSGIEWMLVARVNATGESEVEFPLVMEPELTAGPETSMLGPPTELLESAVRVSRTRFRPGEVVEGSLDLGRVRYIPGIDAVRSAHVQLRWYAKHWGTEEERVAVEHVVPRHAGEQELSFALRLPDRPYSFTGKELSVVWVVEAPGLLSRTMITVSPE